MQFAAVIAIPGFFLPGGSTNTKKPKKGGGKKPVSFRDTGGTYLLCTLSNLRESSGQVFGSTPLLSKYCPVVPEVKTGKPTYIHWAACFPHCCGALAKRTLLAGSSTQTRCVEYFISRDIIGEEADTTSFKCTVRYARTGPALSTQHGLDIGWSATCDRAYTIVVHINVVMFRGSFQCKTPSRHDVCLHDEYFTSNRLFNDTRRLFSRIKHIWYLV